MRTSRAAGLVAVAALLAACSGGTTVTSSPTVSDPTAGAPAASTGAAPGTGAPGASGAAGSGSGASGAASSGTASAGTASSGTASSGTGARNPGPPSPAASGAGSTRTTPSPRVRLRSTPAPTPRRSTAASAVASRSPAAPRSSARPPAGGAGRYAFPVQGCPASYARSHHDYPAADIFAPRGCRVVAPVNGRIDEVTAVDTWRAGTNLGAARGGLSFSLVGVDGVRYYGSHLASLQVAAGQQVRAGEQIGTVGNSGDARGIGTHLHFGLSWPTGPGIWWVRRGELYPQPYLDSWRAGAARSPAAAVARLHARLGDVPRCSIDC